MRSLLRFQRGLLGLPLHLQLWVGLLVGVNLVTPFFFLGHIEARVTLAAGLVGIALMTALTGRFGFSRIVGLGHVAWLPLLVFLAARVTEIPAATDLGLWLRIVIALDAISLVFDAVDAVRFLRGDRAETVPGLDPSVHAIGGRA